MATWKIRSVKLLFGGMEIVSELACVPDGISVLTLFAYPKMEYIKINCMDGEEGATERKHEREIKGKRGEGSAQHHRYTFKESERIRRDDRKGKSGTINISNRQRYIHRYCRYVE